MTIVIEHIAEVERRKLHLALGYGSLFDYLTKKLGYSESSAYRRMQAARAFLQVPEIKPQLESGSLKLSQISLVQKTLRQEEKVAKRKVSSEEKKEIFEAISGKTGTETEKFLDQKLDIPLPKKTFSEKHRRDESVELNLRIPRELYEKLRKAKELYSHIEPDADWLKVIELMTDDVIKKRGLLVKKPATRRFGKMQVHGGGPAEAHRVEREQRHDRRKPIPAKIKRLILTRDQEKCQYIGNDGRKCESRHQLQIDHIVPVWQGGDNSPQNLRILCRAHNAFRFGQEEAVG